MCFPYFVLSCCCPQNSPQWGFFGKELEATTGVANVRLHGRRHRRPTTFNAGDSVRQFEPGGKLLTSTTTFITRKKTLLFELELGFYFGTELVVMGRARGLTHGGQS